MNEKRIFINNSKKGWCDTTNQISFLFDNGRSYSIVFNGKKNYYFSYGDVKIVKNIECLKVSSIMLGRFLKLNNPSLYKSLKKKDKFFILDSFYGIREFPKITYNAYLDYLKGKDSIYKYFLNLSLIYDLDSGNDFLSSQYEKVENNFYNNNVLADLLEKNVYKKNTKNVINEIFPFPYNKSQINAVTNAMNYNISIIQGPPGTGKTQTILNLISNILLENKNVAIISNNNRAVLNVYEKLENSGYGFLCANLGNLENRGNFFSENHEIPKLNFENKNIDLCKLIEYEQSIFDIQAKLKKYITEKEELQKEYDIYNRKQNGESIILRKKISADEILFLLVKLENKVKINFLKRLSYMIKYGIKSNEFNNIPLLYEKLRNSYVIRKLYELTVLIERYNKNIEKYNELDVSKKVQQYSINKLNRMLLEKYSKACLRNFNKDNYKNNFSEFIKRYPIILSSTYCLPSSVSRDFTFDYIIIDEASQSTITTVLPSLVKGKNLVVIGDDKQLPPVETTNILYKESEIYSNFNIDTSLRDNGKSFLSFVQNYLEEKSIITLLKEHYRCAKQIIGFSNKRIYNSNLQLMNDDDLNVHMKIVKTVPGNHARKNDTGGTGLYNQREIDEIEFLINNITSDKSIGVITPYRRQAELLREKLPNNIEVGTIHTFQGREEDIIIFSTVANDISDYEKDNEIIKSFVNNEQLINVAVTRAKDKFILVTSDKIFNSNLGIVADLIKYIKFETNFEINEGKISSVFDILYKDYEAMRKKMLRSKEIITETIIEKVLNKILLNEMYMSLTYSMHVNLKSIVKIDSSLYSNEELNYLNHPWTHIDFVIFNKFDKIPLLAIEIDGVKYHEQNLKQNLHDSIKDKCLNYCELPLLRLKTNGSDEEAIIMNTLSKILNNK